MDRCENFEALNPTLSIISSRRPIFSQPPRDVVKVTGTHSGTELEIAIIASLSC